MNGLSLRISTGAKKCKNIMSLKPVVISFPAVNALENELVETFLQAGTADEQLVILKQILDKEKNPVNLNIVKLLVVVFFHSEAKHPVKCFLTRHITKSKHLQVPFIDLLSSEITLHLKNDSSEYKSYKETVPKIAMCLENFPAGTCAVEDVKEQLAPYLAHCLIYCIHTVRTEKPSPTQKNEIYNLAHLSLRLLLHIITKNQRTLDQEDDGHPPHVKVPQRLFYPSSIKESIDVLLHDKDVPMDTKSVCGLVAMSLNTYINNDRPNHDAWKTFMYSTANAAITDDVQLAFYSAIITTVPMQNLQENDSLDEPAPIVTIVKTFMDIVERSSSDGVLILGVTRTLLQVSKGLSELKVKLGVQLTRQLLAFVWVHLEHYMDSVRHLTAQILASVVHYCAALEIDGLECDALGPALAGLAALGARRRGFHAGVRGCARALGAGRVLRRVAPLPRLLPALAAPHVASTTAATLDDLLVRHSQETETSVIHEQWVVPIIQFVQTNDLEPEVLTILENLLAKAVKLDQKLVTFILPHIKQACESPEYELKNLLVLLSVARASLAKLAGDAASDQQELWGGVLPYKVLEDAVVDAREEVRLAALRLVCAGAGRAARGELAVCRRYLAHAALDQPHCRQRARAMLYKFIKRIFDGMRAAKRSGDEERGAMYRELYEELRRTCYHNLQPGSHARRTTALQLLQALEPPSLPCERTWKRDYVKKLLSHLEDSYETNKALALEILQHVPLEHLKEAASLEMSLHHIVCQASALRPTECVSAAYKLELLWRRMPDYVLELNPKYPDVVAEPALFSLLQELVSQVPLEYEALQQPRDSPTYGLLHCIAHLLDAAEPAAIGNCSEWKELIKTIIDACMVLIDKTGAVVNHASPEGVMPPNCQYTDYGNNAGVKLANGQQVTAQMVLLCAWRTHKEATSVLGSIGARLPVDTVGTSNLFALGSILSSALSAARHRGAFEQAYVAYERVLHRMWRDSNPQVAEWPARRLAGLRAWARAPAAGSRAADRRSAGLPFLVQALVSTEVGAGGPGTGLRDVMTELLRRAEVGAEAKVGAEVEVGAEAAANHRAHACNVLRALFRDSSLEAAVQGYVGEGLRVALKGFEGASWVERNSSTLLLSALMTRVFGVTRARHLSARNRMTGRVFYLRYPHLYDIMLNKLKEVSESEEKLLLCPSLYPVLLLLARLYPSSLEGTESNLKLVSFVPHVMSCARSRVLLTRRLAAAACVALIAPDRYVEHLQYLLGLVSEPRIERNYCHGLLLQICALLENKPEGVQCAVLAHTVPGTLWLLAQECHPVLHQHVLLLTALLTRFPETLRQETRDAIEARLRAVLFEPVVSAAASGRELCLDACLRLLLRLSPADVPDLVLRALQHDVHEVSGAALDYLLGLYGRGESGAEVEAEEVELEAEVEVELESEVETQTGVKAEVEAGVKPGVEAEAVLRALRLCTDYLPLVASPLRRQGIWQCDPQRALKHLEVLVAVGETQKLVMSVVPPCPADVACPSPHDVVHSLRHLIDWAPENTTHLFLESITSYVFRRLEESSELTVSDLLHASEAVRSCSAPHRARAARLQAARACSRGAALLQRARRAHAQILFELECNLYASVAALLRDAEPELRARAAAAALRLAGHQTQACVVAERAAEVLLDTCLVQPRALPLLTALALGAAPPAPDTAPPAPDTADADDCRVFEPSEQDNERGERALWTAACAHRVNDLCARGGDDPLNSVAQLFNQWSFPYIDASSIDAIQRLAAGGTAVVLGNPTVELFVRMLKREI